MPRKSVMRASGGREGQQRDTNKQIIRMLGTLLPPSSCSLTRPCLTLTPVSVVVLFFVSWAPFHFQRLGYVYFREHEYFRTVNQYLFYLSGCFYFLSSTLNPILYNLMSAKYRKEFQAVLLCKSRDSPTRPPDYLHTCATSATNLLTRYFYPVLSVFTLF